MAWEPSSPHEPLHFQSQLDKFVFSPSPLSHSILIYTTTPNHSLTPLLGYYHSVRFALWWSLLKGNPYMIWYIPSSVGFDLSSLHLRPFPLTINRHGERWILKREKKPFFIFVFYFYCSTSTFKGSLCFFYFFNLIHLAILSVRSFPFGFCPLLSWAISKLHLHHNALILCSVCFKII